MTDLKSILLDADIFPLGDFECVPVRTVRDGEALSYPEVAVLCPVNNIEDFLNEAMVTMTRVGKGYVKDRMPHLSPLLSMDQVRDVLSGVGFTKETYQSYSLRKLGTNTLEDFVCGRTRAFFESLPCDYFRMQYGVANKDWTTKFHIDHHNFKRHGFRAMVPLNIPAIMSFLVAGRERIYELQPGYMYFVNIARYHRGFNPFHQSRINLLLQLASDELMLRGEALSPLSARDVEARFSTHLSTEIMEVWR